MSLHTEKLKVTPQARFYTVKIIILINDIAPSISGIHFNLAIIKNLSSNLSSEVNDLLNIGTSK